MICPKDGKTVLVRDCESCFTERNMLALCIFRGFIWGVPDENEPMWEHDIEQGKKKLSRRLEQ